MSWWFILALVGVSIATVCVMNAGFAYWDWQSRKLHRDEHERALRERMESRYRYPRRIE